MKKVFQFLILTAIVILSSFSKVQATHIVGADLTYTYVSPNTIHLKLRFYRNCAGISPPATGKVHVSSFSCGQDLGAINLPLSSNHEIVTSDCIDTTNATTCNGGTRFGVEEYIYEGNVFLPMACSDWLIEYEECCRSSNQTLLVPFTLYISTTYNNLSFPINSSPQFLAYPITSICLGVPFNFLQNANDPDGDSLVYNLVDVNELSGVPGVYVNPYSGAYPVSSSSGVAISQNGTISLTANVVQKAVTCVRVDEYRNGFKIGSVTRDMQVKVEAICNPNMDPHFITAGFSGTPVPCQTMEFTIPFNHKIRCSSIVNDDLRAVNSLGFPIPIISINPVNCIDDLTDSIHVMMADFFTTGINYVFTKTGSDGNTFLGKCGFSMPAYDTIKYVVNDPSIWKIKTDTIGCLSNDFTAAFDDFIYCYTVDQDASSLALFDAGNANATIPLASAYPYCGPSGDSVSNQILINFASTQILTGPLYLLVKKGTDNTTIANSCGRFLNSGDTLAIYYVKGNISVSLGNDIDVCSNINELPVKLDAGYDSSSVLTYQWYLNGSPISGANNSTYEADTTGNYSLVASISAGCAGSDDVQINVINMPVIDLGDDKNICEGDEVLLDMGPDGMIYQWYFNGIAINMEIYSELFASTPGQYVGALINYGSSGHLCFSLDTVIVTSTSAPLLTLSDETICANLFPFVIDADNTGASFQWSTSATDTLQQISVFESGIYGVTITNNSGCSIMEWMELTTEDPLDAPILDCGTVSANGYDFIYSWADVPGNSGYEVSFDNINWLQANTPTSSTSHGTNTFSTAFLVRAIMNGACSYGAMAPYVSCEIQVPDIVTPNGDGINDLFLIPNINSYPDNTFSVYSRWGVKVYSETGYNNTSKVFSGKDLPSGRYFYTLVYGNEKILKSGTLTISK